MRSTEFVVSSDTILSAISEFAILQYGCANWYRMLRLHCMVDIYPSSHGRILVNMLGCPPHNSNPGLLPVVCAQVSFSYHVSCMFLHDLLPVSTRTDISLLLPSYLFHYSSIIFFAIVPTPSIQIRAVHPDYYETVFVLNSVSPKLFLELADKHLGQGCPITITLSAVHTQSIS